MKTFTRTVLVADEGKILTNGSTFARVVELGNWDSESNWNEVNEEEFNEGNENEHN